MKRQLPEGISDGLELDCGVCGCWTPFDYVVSDEFWRRHVPERLARDVVCLACLDAMCCGEGLFEALEHVQFVGSRITIVLRAEQVHHHFDDRRTG